MTRGGSFCSGVAPGAGAAFASGSEGGVSFGSAAVAAAADLSCDKSLDLSLDFSLDCALFWAAGGVWLLKKYWETNITAPIKTKASSSRTSIDISLGGLQPLPPITGSAIQ